MTILRNYKFRLYPNRDFNAAKNILTKALNKIGREPPEFTPVEMEPLPLGASSVAEAGRSGL